MKAWNFICKLVKQMLVPVLLAAAFTFYDAYTNKTGFSINQLAKVFFPALFFIMYFYGQYKRVEKHSEDKASFDGLNTEIMSLKSMVENLSVSPVPPLVKTNTQFESATSLIEGAFQLKETGNNVAALLQAGLAYELSIRNFFAAIYPSEYFHNINLLQVINRLEKVLSPGVVSELHSLRQIRNRTTHLRENELNDLPDVERNLNAYRWAINTLNSELEQLKSKM